VNFKIQITHPTLSTFMKNLLRPRFLAALAVAALCSCSTTPPGPGPAPTAVITLTDYVLTGHYVNGEVTFTLQATATPPAGKVPGDLTLLSGPVSPTSIPEALAPFLEMRGNDIVLQTKDWSSLKVDLPFRAYVHEGDGWKTVDFTPAAANIRQIVLEGWPEGAKVEFSDASQAVHANGRITANLPGTGHVALRWKDTPPETEGKLFFSATGAVVDTVSPGILRQMDQIVLHILQGKLDHVDLDLAGDGEVTSVESQGKTILGWKVLPGATAGLRRLSVDLNAPQSGDFLLLVQIEAPMPALPATAKPPHLTPTGTSNYGGLLRVQNEGTVRLEVTGTTGLSQIAPEQFQVARPQNAPPSTQAFAYRFADAGYAYAVSADNVLPEFTADSIIAYHLGETDTYLEAEINLDIREAPLRELNLLIPADWALSVLQAPNLADHMVSPAGAGRAQLRLVFGQPIMGRQVVRMKLERNASSAGAAAATAATEWAVPPVSIIEPNGKEAKSAHGFVGVTSDASLRLTPTTMDKLEDATAAFPLKLDNLQAAWRYRDEPWSATLKVEHLAASIQADALHIFSVGQEMALGSTVINFSIAGAPVNVLRVQNTGGYRHIEFTGRYKRDVTQTGDVYEIYLDHSVSGAYTLLATYELPFKASGDSLTFTGMQPLGVQTEQGHVLLASSYPFNITPEKISPGMSRLEAAEIPAEYRLLCDAPILACYQYAARPFDATLHLQPLVDGSTVDQVVDIGTLETHISSTGEVRTIARYLLKSKGHDFLQLSMPKGATLWNVTVEKQTVVPVADTNASSSALLVPLPRKGDPNVPLSVEVEYTAGAKDAVNVTVVAPTIHAAVLVTDWKLSGDTDRLLRAEPDAPLTVIPRVSAFGWLTQIVTGKDVKPRPPISPYLLRFEGPNTPELTHRQAFFCGLALALAGLLLLRIVRAKSLLAKISVGGVGAIVALIGIVLLAQVGVRSAHVTDQPAVSRDVHLSIPVTEADHALSFAITNEITPKIPAPAQHPEPLAWLLLPGAILLLLGLAGSRGALWCAISLLLILVGLLSLPQGPQWFCEALAGMLAGAMALALSGLCKKKSPSAAPVNPGAPTAAAAAVMLALGLWLSGSATVHAAVAPPKPPPQPPSAPGSATPEPIAALDAAPAAPTPGLVLSLVQTGTVQETNPGQESFAHMQAEMTWRAEKGSQITVLRAPAVLTHFTGDQAHLHLAQGQNTDTAYVLTADTAGTYKISLAYDVRAYAGQAGAAAIILPTPGGLVNLLTLDLARADLDAKSNNAVSLHTTPGTGGHPRVEASFGPNASPTLEWSPRARDLSAEKPEFYADWRQLYIPAAGIVDGLHDVNIRLAQGQIKELVFSVPENLTISQVDAANLANWRFDPDQHKLHAYFDPPRTTAFDVVIHSQASTSPLTYTATLTPIRLDGATTDSGMMATATGSEVELGTVTPDNLATVNLDDFPPAVTRAATPRGENLTVRRAYSYGIKEPSLKVEAVAVVPDVRVDSLQRLSLGEDRILLAAHLNVAVNRAGIFKLSFPLPAGFELESVSGDQLSHQTESGTGANRIITLNLKGKTIGNAAFDIQLSAPGMTAQQNWTAPRLTITEADKQTGQLILLPELGLRPQIHTRDNLTQVDPKELRIDTPGALVFRLLQSDWTLALDIEKVPPHIQADVLQDVTVREGSTEVRANLNYQIDNAGVRELRLQVPTGAMGVHITGQQVSDAVPVEGQTDQWLIRLQRRSIGALALTATYQLPPAGTDNKLTLSGLQALGIDLQRGYIDLRSRGRLETRVTTAPSSLHPSDWESIPPALRRDLDGSTPSQTFTAVEAAFTLPVEVVRHEAANVLPARVESVHMRSLVAPDGQLLTEVTVRLFPGDKRHLNVQLPGGSKFWFAFVNDKGVTPSLGSQGKGEILLPLEPNPVPSEAATVEFLYQQKAPASSEWKDTELTGPRFDLPLQNISWQLYLPETWKVSSWADAWQKKTTEAIIPVTAGKATFDDYLAKENQRLNLQNAKAENFLVQGNQLLQQGQQMQARELFNSAYQISQKDSAFNEDARVQLQNLRETQAMIGLNNASNGFSNTNNLNINGGGGALNAPQGTNLVLSQTELLNFTDQQARKVLGANAAEENAVLAALAHTLVKQQADTLPHPVAIRATLPERGAVYEFTQSLLVNANAGLVLKISAGPDAAQSDWAAYAALIALGLLLAGALRISRKPAKA